MNKNDYVSLEVAKLLKEKGYDEYCEAYYHISHPKEATEEECFEAAPNKDFKNSNNKFRIGAPSLYQAHKWLLQHNLFVSISLYGKEWYWSIHNAVNGNMICSLFDKTDKTFPTNEEALNSGIQQARLLI